MDKMPVRIWAQQTKGIPFWSPREDELLSDTKRDYYCGDLVRELRRAVTDEKVGDVDYWIRVSAAIDALEEDDG